jgi:hypothetical protein
MCWGWMTVELEDEGGGDDFFDEMIFIFYFL